ncbi:UNVERIFIED_CONTAM: hypothetical protein K2H54_076996 [Gekko kuhli]
MIQGLQPGTEYTVTVNPVFGATEGPVVTAKAVTLSSSAVQTLKATEITVSSALILWNAVPGATGYRITWGPTPGFNSDLEITLLYHKPNPYLLNGEEGIVGVRGPVGMMGPNGIVGVKGEKGDTGFPGPKGERGDPMTIFGPQGYKGSKGEQGEGGPSGFDGDKGEKGEDGPAGEKGVKGEAGVKGAMGLFGTRGPVGQKVSKMVPMFTRRESSGSQDFRDLLGKKVTLVFLVTLGTKAQRVYVACLGGQDLGVQTESRGSREARGTQEHPGQTDCWGPR